MRKILLMLCVLVCLLPVMCLGEQAGQTAAPTVRIALKRLALTDRADLYLCGAYTLTTAQGTTIAVPPATKLTVQVRDNQLYLFYHSLSLCAGSGLTLQQNEANLGSLQGLTFTDNGNVYPGDLELTVQGGMLQPVLTLGLEEYLMGVVPYEMSDSFPLEALKAQAVCARTYAMAAINPDAEFDMTDTTQHQVFRGISEDNVNAIRAVEETAGVVGFWQGKLANCYYSASNGGQTETVDNLWNAPGNWNYYQMTDDPYDYENPDSVVLRARLRKDGTNLPDAFVQLLAKGITKQMKAAGFLPDSRGLRVDEILSVELTEPRYKAPSRLYTRMKVTFRWSGRTGTQLAATPAPDGTVPAPVMEFGPYTAASDAATVTVDLFPDGVNALGLSVYGAGNELVTVKEESGEFVLESRRYGHGVGMSQRGAQQMAGKYGKTFTEILAFYYPGMELMVAPAGSRPLPTTDPRLAATPAPAATPTPRPTLMPVTQPLPEGAWYASVEGIADDSSLNLRAQPNGVADIIMRLYKHQLLMVLPDCQEPGWVHVKTDSAEGYVKESFLEKWEN
ncbi:MAG: SpoIID/LytB domain-containing protein [Clostridia bacterium]|nr:SpoIID/LytB domain-containing protein [Clostridia bacterium]